MARGTEVVMYQSIPSLNISPRANPRGIFLKGRIPHSPGTKKVRNPDPRGRKIVLKPHPGAIIFRNPAKNSIKILMCLEILKQ